MRASYARVTRLVALLALSLLACQAPATTPANSAQAAGSADSSTARAASGPAGWDQVVDAAKQEGKVVVYAPPGTEYRRVIIDAFERAYPGIKVAATFADINEQFSRLSAERTAGRYLADVWVSGTNPTVTATKEAGFTVPLQPALLLPEVVDPSAWLQQRLWWADAAEPYTTLMFQGSVNNIVSYNTKLVDPSQFTS